MLQYAKIVDMAQGPAGGRSLTTHDALAAQLALQQQRVLDARNLRQPVKSGDPDTGESAAAVLVTRKAKGFRDP